MRSNERKQGMEKMRDGKSDRVRQALLHVEREGNAPLGVQLLGGARADTREHAKR